MTVFIIKIVRYSGNWLVEIISDHNPNMNNVDGLPPSPSVHLPSFPASKPNGSALLQDHDDQQDIMVNNIVNIGPQTYTTGSAGDILAGVLHELSGSPMSRSAKSPISNYKSVVSPQGVNPNVAGTIISEDVEVDDFDELTLKDIMSMNSVLSAVTVQTTNTVKSQEEIDAERKRANTLKLINNLSTKL